MGSYADSYNSRWGFGGDISLQEKKKDYWWHCFSTLAYLYVAIMENVSIIWRIFLKQGI